VHAFCAMPSCKHIRNCKALLYVYADCMSVSLLDHGYEYSAGQRSIVFWMLQALWPALGRSRQLQHISAEGPIFYGSEP